MMEGEGARRRGLETRDPVLVDQTWIAPVASQEAKGLAGPANMHMLVTAPW